MEMQTQNINGEEAVFNPMRLLRVTDSNLELIRLLVDNFCADIQKQFSAIRNSAGQGSAEVQYSALHKMKGAVGNIGAERIHALLAVYCERLKQEKTPLSVEDFDVIERRLSELLAYVGSMDWDAVQICNS